MKKTLLVLALALCSLPSFAATACTQAAIAAAVAAATNGQTVTVSSGTTSFSSAVDIPATKYITVDGSAGCTITNSPAFTVEPSTAGETRITGFTLTGPGGNPPSTTVYVSNSSVSTSTWRIDHNTFNNASGGTYIAVSGLGPGLIDHNTIEAAGGSETIHLLAAGDGSNAGWTDNITPGGPLMVFIETNTFTNASTSTICSAVEGYYGSRMVFRYNNTYLCQVDQHGTAGRVGVRWYEIYNNTFNVPTGENQCCVIVLRAGAGVVWGNTKGGSGTVQSGNALQVSEEDTGTWPLAYQVGSGINGDTNGFPTCPGPLNTAPTYFWNNAVVFGAVTQSGTVNLNRDYFTPASPPTTMKWEEQSGDTCSTTYTYVPYTYPHPLVSGGQAAASTCAPGGGTYTATQAPACTNFNSGTTVQCYTTNGAMPATNGSGTACTTGSPVANGGTVSIPTTGTTLKIIAGTSTLTDSPVSSYIYTLQGASPVASPAGGTYPNTQTVTLTQAQSQSMCYTVDGSRPTSNGSGVCSNGTLYSTPISVSGSEVLQAIGMASGFTDSGISSNTYNFTNAAPAFTAPAPGTFTSAQTPTLTSATSGAILCYRTDGTAPTAPTPGTCGTGSTTLANGSTINIAITTTVEALATKAGYANSSVATAVYTINIPPGQAAASTCAPGTGTYTTTKTPACTNHNTGTKVQCYTLDGSTPATNGVGTGCTHGSTVASGGTVSITTTATTLAIIAGTSTLTDSPVTSYTYTLQGAKPVAAPATGTYNNSQTVTLTQAQSQAICYTTNGTTPTSNGSGACSNGSLYSTPLTISSTTVLQSIGMASGFVDSLVRTDTYTLKNAVPAFTAPPPGTFSGPTAPTVTSVTTGATLCYTTDKTVPTATVAGTCDAGATTLTNGSTISLSVTTTIKVIATKAGYTNSAYAAGVYTISHPTPAVCSAPTYTCKLNTTQAGAQAIIQNSPTPNVGGLTGTCTVVTPTDFSTPIARLSDNNFDPSFNGHSYFADAGASGDETLSNTDGTLWIGGGTGGYGYPFTVYFDGNTCVLSRLYVSTYSSIGGMRFSSDDPGWSYATRTLLFIIDPTNPAIDSYNFSAQTNPGHDAGGTPPSNVVLFDFRHGQTGAWGTTSANCLASGYSMTWSSYGKQNKYSTPDQIFLSGFSAAGGQDTGVDVVAYKVGSGCTYLNTSTGAVTGDWGSTGTVGISDRFKLHNVKISKDGLWAVIEWADCTTTCTADPSSQYLWQIGTTNLYPGCSSPNKCTGHYTEGKSDLINADNSPTWQQVQRVYGNNSTGSNIAMGLPWANSACTGYTTGLHQNWSNVDTSDTYPFFYSSTVSGGMNPYICALVDEVDAVNLAGTVFRFAHTFNSDQNPNLQINAAIGAVSQDGRFFMWGSDWEGTLGSTSGGSSCTLASNCRGDLFLAALTVNTSTVGPAKQMF